MPGYVRMDVRKSKAYLELKREEYEGQQEALLHVHSQQKEKERKIQLCCSVEQRTQRQGLRTVVSVVNDSFILCFH